MTTEEAKQLYLMAFPPGDPEEAQYVEEVQDWDDIANDMRRVVEAPSDAKAADVIDWWLGWGSWQPFETAEDAARFLRAEWTKRAA